MDDPSAMPARLEAFLLAVDPTLEAVSVRGYVPIIGGYSRSMARFAADCTRGGVEVTEHLILRGDPPPGQAVLETDRDAEWALLRALGPTSVPMPAARFYDATGEALGTKALVIDLAPGPSLLAAANAPDADLPALADALCAAAVAIHATDLDALPATLARPTTASRGERKAWDAYLDEVIAQWSRLERAHLESDPYMRYMGAWLDTHRPPPAPFTLVHGDFQSANIIATVDGLRVVDWELAHIGDPREDLGWYKAVASVAPPDLVGLDDAAFCARYRAATGLGEDVVNPLTLNWFSVLSAISVYGPLLDQMAMAATGASDSIILAYNQLAGMFAHHVWMMASGGLEAAMA